MTARSGTEKRQLDSVVGVRLSPATRERLEDIAAASGMRPGTYLRKLVEQHVDGSPSVEKAPKTRHVLSSVDRTAMATYSRHAGVLAGALIQTAKAARLGKLITYHAAVETLLRETLALKQRVDQLRADADR